MVVRARCDSHGVELGVKAAVFPVRTETLRDHGGENLPADIPVLILVSGMDTQTLSST